MTHGRLFPRKYTTRGAVPGAHARPEEGQPQAFRVITYNEDSLVEQEFDPAGELPLLHEPGQITWIDVHGLGDGKLVERIGERFELHPLAVADVINVGQRPKIEDYDTFLYIVVRMLYMDENQRVGSEQVSLFIGKGWAISFQERPGDCLDSLRERLRKGRKVLRGAGADYLGVQIIDTIIDGYFPVLEAYGERLEDIETRVLENPSKDVLNEVYEVKRDLMALRRASWPTRDMLSTFLHEGDELLSPESRPYLRDTADHVIQIVDVTETYRELAGSFIDVYLSSISQRTNEVMRVLTVIATIFIPLTFLAGVYGMNFDRSQPSNMPELGWEYGYVAFIAVCLVVGGGLLLLFHRLGWLGGGHDE